MSPRRGPASPLKKIKLRITLEADRPSLVLASKAVKRPSLAGNKLVSKSQYSNPEGAIAELTRLGEAAKAKPKDFK
jgi:hypothetical protein